MSHFSEFLKEALGEHSTQTHVAMLCKIVSFDPQKMKASVQPMQKGLPMIEHVPVALQKAGPFFIRVPFERDDIVVVVFADTIIDRQVNTGADAKEEGDRKHDLSDAIVVGGISPFNSPLPAEAGLVIAKKDLSAKIVIQPNGNIIVETNSNVNIDADGNVNIDCDVANISCGSGSITATDGFSITRHTDTVSESVVWE